MGDAERSYSRMVWDRAWADMSKLTGGLPSPALLALLTLAPFAPKAYSLGPDDPLLSLFDTSSFIGGFLSIAIFVAHVLAAPARIHADQRHHHKIALAAMGDRAVAAERLCEQLRRSSLTIGFREDCPQCVPTMPPPQHFNIELSNSSTTQSIEALTLVLEACDAVGESTLHAPRTVVESITIQPTRTVHVPFLQKSQDGFYVLRETRQGRVTVFRFTPQPCALVVVGYSNTAPKTEQRFRVESRPMPGGYRGQITWILRPVENTEAPQLQGAS